MKQIVEFIKNEMPKLGEAQRRYINGHLWSFCSDVGIDDECLGFIGDDVSDEEMGRQIQEAKQQFIDGKHRNQELIMQRVCEVFESGEGMYTTIDTFKDFLVDRYRSIRELITAYQGLSKKLPGAAVRSEGDLDERIVQKMEEIIKYFPELFTKESFLEAVRIQDAEDRVKSERDREMAGGEINRRN